MDIKMQTKNVTNETLLERTLHTKLQLFFEALSILKEQDDRAYLCLIYSFTKFLS